MTIPPVELLKGQLSPEVLVPRLGDYLIEKEVLRKEDLQRALRYQEEMQAKGQPKLIGQALLELGAISREVLDQAITEQIFQLQSALQRANEKLEARVRERTLELENALNRLSELSQLKSNFIANISHELRTPLTHLRGYLDLLMDTTLGPVNNQQVDALSVMLKAEDRLERLIENLIRFSDFSRGSLDLQLESVDLLDVFMEIVPVAEQKCGEKGLVFHTKIPQGLPSVKADKQKLPWILNHLLDNAIKFTPEGGSVHVGASIETGIVKLYVADTGIGIAVNQIDEIFEPFHQVDGSSTRRYGGTGLGLAMVRQVVEAHGSNIVVRSKKGKGSYFEFSLPIADAGLER
ncbi:MAG: HAMP domain-containing sensor histidine kinase [Chloroflexota bacterium]|nr:HAMP domain-containing sensor histidine kinase [Chloroflexota bacterium]